MIETNQYKKGVITLTRKIAKINPQLGVYTAHFLNEKAQFVVQFTNGKLEVDIWVARACEEDPDTVVPAKLAKAAQFYWNEDNAYARPKTILKKWKELFATEKEAPRKTNWVKY